MASTQEFVDFVVEQFEHDCGVTAKKMFGEYGLFSRGKMFALVCDNRVFMKPTAGGRSFVGTVVEDEPYPGAKPCFVVTDRVDDREWISELARITTRELPMPKRRSR